MTCSTDMTDISDMPKGIIHRKLVGVDILKFHLSSQVDARSLAKNIAAPGTLGRSKRFCNLLHQPLDTYNVLAELRLTYLLAYIIEGIGHDTSRGVSFSVSDVSPPCQPLGAQSLQHHHGKGAA